MPKSDGELYFDEAAEVSWLNYLKGFESEVLPIFLKNGYSKDAAFQFWMLNKQYNLTCDLIDEIKELKEELREIT